ncbi:hypothetical protein CJ030_MR8G008976 [Morella rubra]|uniref:Uncharacterized protein n=1 Tax=Morella rubra TaxID=262757 RepID=A0A6A1UNG5_9ROSI|nr:hypothetical protein CJ030_MR8G008976 [Morella rubra]
MDKGSVIQRRRRSIKSNRVTAAEEEGLESTTVAGEEWLESTTVPVGDRGAEDAGGSATGVEERISNRRRVSRGTSNEGADAPVEAEDSEEEEMSDRASAPTRGRIKRCRRETPGITLSRPSMTRKGKSVTLELTLMTHDNLNKVERMSVNISGVTGSIKFNSDGNLIHPAYEVINIIGKGMRTLAIGLILLAYPFCLQKSCK